MFGLPAVHTYTQQWFGYYFCHIFPYITPWVYPVGMIAQTGSVYLTICVTIERYVAVCLPLKARYLCTFGRAKIYVAGVGLGAVLYNLTRFWEVTWEIQFIPELEANITNVQPTELRQHATYIRVYITWCYLVVMYIVPFSCLALFNLLIYREVISNIPWGNINVLTFDCWLDAASLRLRDGQQIMTTKVSGTPWKCPSCCCSFYLKK